MALPQQGTETHALDIVQRDGSIRVNGLTPTGDGNTIIFLFTQQKSSMC